MVSPSLRFSPREMASRGVELTLQDFVSPTRLPYTLGIGQVSEGGEARGRIVY